MERFKVYKMRCNSCKQVFFELGDGLLFCPNCQQATANVEDTEETLDYEVTAHPLTGKISVKLFGERAVRRRRDGRSPASTN